MNTPDQAPDRETGQDIRARIKEIKRYLDTMQKEFNCLMKQMDRATVLPEKSALMSQAVQLKTYIMRAQTALNTLDDIIRSEGGNRWL